MALPRQPGGTASGLAGADRAEVCPAALGPSEEAAGRFQDPAELLVDSKSSPSKFCVERSAQDCSAAGRKGPLGCQQKSLCANIDMFLVFLKKDSFTARRELEFHLSMKGFRQVPGRKAS